MEQYENTTAKLCFLGTGTSQGVPIIGCNCSVCKSENPKNKRLRTSALITFEDTTILIDAGPDFRYQLLRENISKLDAILITHAHRDHIGGLDDVRPFNYYLKRSMPIYANASTIQDIKANIPYAFSDHPYPGAPSFILNEIKPNGETFKIGPLIIDPIEVIHFKMSITAYRIGNLTYITDASFISEESVKKMEGSDILIVNALRKEPHISHFTLSQALELVERIKPKEAYFTHISHNLEHSEISAQLPEHVHLAYDGLELTFKPFKKA